MAKAPVLKPREVATILQHLGFAEVRQRGSHKQFRHPDGRGTTVPFHSGAISRPFCYVGSQKIPVSPSVSNSSINKVFPRRREALPMFRLVNQVTGPDGLRFGRGLRTGGYVNCRPVGLGQGISGSGWRGRKRTALARSERPLRVVI